MRFVRYFTIGVRVWVALRKKRKGEVLVLPGRRIRSPRKTRSVCARKNGSMADAGEQTVALDASAEEPMTPSTYLEKLERVGQLMLHRALRYYRWACRLITE